MPVYVYRNLNTHETFEVEQRITEDAWTRHPESGDPVKRLVQPVGIAFKGSGFYVTDARGTSKAGANGSAAGASDGGVSDGGAKESGSSEKRDAGTSSGGKEAAKSDAGSGSGAAAAKKSSTVD